MKIFDISFKIFVLAAFFVLCPSVFTSCEKHSSFGDDDITIKPKDNDSDSTPDLSDYIQLQSASAFNYGGFWTNDADDYILVLTEGTLNADGSFRGKGTEVSIDILTERSATDYGLAPGKYNITTNDYGEFVFIAGFVDGGNTQPTYIYRQFSSNTSDYDLAIVTDGTLSISYDADSNDYTVICDFFDEDGTNYKYAYIGTIQFSEGEIEEDEDDYDDYDYDSIPENVVVDNVEKVVATNLGNIYTDLADEHYDWEIIMTTDNEAEWIGLEFVVDANTDASVIPDGTYYLCQDDYLSIGVAVPFVYDEYTRTGYGCYYGYGNYFWYGGTKGSVRTERIKDNEYKIDFDIEDENEQSAGTFKGSYQGKVEIKSSTSLSSAAQRKFVGGDSCSRMKKASVRAPKSAFPKRKR